MTNKPNVFGHCGLVIHWSFWFGHWEFAAGWLAASFAFLIFGIASCKMYGLNGLFLT
jgi:hypothetical protein